MPPDVVVQAHQRREQRFRLRGAVILKVKQRPIAGDEPSRALDHFEFMALDIRLDRRDPFHLRQETIERLDRNRLLLALDLAERKPSGIDDPRQRHRALRQDAGLAPQRGLEGVDVGNPVHRQVGAEHLMQQATRLEGIDDARLADVAREKHRMGPDIGAGLDDVVARRQRLAEKLDLAKRPFAIDFERFADEGVIGNGEEQGRFAKRKSRLHVYASLPSCACDSKQQVH